MRNDDFICALEQRDLSALSLIPKGNMHSHGGKGASADFLSERLGVSIKKPTAYFHSLEAMHRWYSKQIGVHCKGMDGLLLRWEGCFAEARRDTLSVMVQSFSPEVVLDVGGMEAFKEILEGFHERYCPDTWFIPELTLPRNCNTHEVRGVLETLLSDGYFKSIDVCFDEFAQPIRAFQPIYQMCSEMGLVLKAHVGEFGDPEDIVEAVEVLQLQEIYHGIAATKSEAVMRWLRERGVVLHICPTSNVYMGLVKEYGTHPIRQLYDAGICVTLGTDDLLIFQSSLSEEYLKLYESGVMTVLELEQVRQYTLPEAVRKRYEG